MRSISALLLSFFLFSLVAPLMAAGKSSYADAFQTIPEREWVGLKFVLLPQPKSLQQYGYQELYRDADKEYAPLRYDDYAGKIVRVTGIGHGKASDGELFDEADLQVQDTGESIHGDIDQGCMNDVAPVADLEAARAHYLGRTLWFSEDHLSTEGHRIPVRQYLPVQVLEIVPGWYASVPIRFIVREKTGQSGYVDVHMSDTNVPEKLRVRGRFEDTFWETDPRKTYPWPAKTWRAIESKEVFVGMTAQQIRMSWGDPPEIIKKSANGLRESWKYDGNHLLSLQNGRLIGLHG